MEEKAGFTNKTEKKRLRFRQGIKAFLNFGMKISHMESEILEQPSIIENLIDKYIDKNGSILIDIPENINKVVMIASGSSYNCGLIMAEILKDKAHCEAECIYSSEFKMYHYLKNNSDILYIFISQSGETSDTLEVLKEVSKYSGNIMCVVNCENSTLWNSSKYRILTCAGKENSIASTKAMSAQLFCLALVVLKIMDSKNIDNEIYLNEVKSLPKVLESVIDKRKDLYPIAKHLSEYKNISVLGGRVSYALAKEGALKIKETSYINTTAYPQGEFLHGHVAILNRKTAVISVSGKDDEKVIVNNLNKIKEKYSAYILTISNIKNSPELAKVTDKNIEIDTQSQLHNIFASLVTLQILALEIAKKLKRNIDTPKGLSKVVT